MRVSREKDLLGPVNRLAGIFLQDSTSFYLYHGASG